MKGDISHFFGKLCQLVQLHADCSRGQNHLHVCLQTLKEELVQGGFLRHTVAQQLVHVTEQSGWLSVSQHFPGKELSKTLVFSSRCALDRFVFQCFIRVPNRWGEENVSHVLCSVGDQGVDNVSLLHAAQSHVACSKLRLHLGKADVWVCRPVRCQLGAYRCELSAVTVIVAGQSRTSRFCFPVCIRRHVVLDHVWFTCP